MRSLRQWMQQEFGGLRDDRDTESYALEFMQNDRIVAKRDAVLVPALIGANDALKVENRRLQARVEYLEQYANDAAAHSKGQAEEIKRLRG